MMKGNPTLLFGELVSKDLGSNEELSFEETT